MGIDTPGPTVAVVVPTHNGAELIADTLASVLAQTRAPDEIVVVDDHSTDATADVVAGFAGIRRLTNTGTGANAARAAGIAATSADLIALLDHDDLWLPHHLEVLSGALERHPTAAASFAHLRPFRRHPPATARHRCLTPRGREGTTVSDTTTPRGREGTTVSDTGGRSLRRRRTTGGAELVELVDPWERFPLMPDIISPSGVMIRRRALDAVGGWPSWNRLPTDIYMWFLLASHGPFVAWRGVTGGYRVHQSTSVRMAGDDAAGLMRSRLQLMREVAATHPPAGADDDAGRQRRLDAYAAVDELALAMSGDGPARFLDAVAALDAHLASPDSPPVEELLEWVRWPLGPLLANDPRARRNYLHAYVSWPPHLRALRTGAVDRMLGLAVFGGVREQPMRPDRWGIPLSTDLARAIPPTVRELTRWLDRRRRRPR